MSMSVLLPMFLLERFRLKRSRLIRRSKKTVSSLTNLGLLSVAGFIAVIFSSSLLADTGSITVQRQKEIINMVLQDCGSCHGMTLKGGLGPALTQDVLKDKHDDMLAGTILYGRTGTAMPPWKTFLNESEARWIVEQLKQGNIKK